MRRVWLALCLAGCASGPAVRPPGSPVGPELSWSYRRGMEIWTPQGMLTKGPQYAGLSDFVRCSPQATTEAAEAERYGRQASLLSGLSIGAAVVGLGGLSGLAFNGRDDSAMAGLLVSGVVVELAAVVLAGNSRYAKVQANGHALDAVNYYNDSIPASACR